MQKRDIIQEELSRKTPEKPEEETKGLTEREAQFVQISDIVNSVKPEFLQEKISLEDAISRIKERLDAMLPTPEETDEEKVAAVVAESPRVNL